MKASGPDRAHRHSARSKGAPGVQKGASPRACPSVVMSDRSSRCTGELHRAGGRRAGSRFRRVLNPFVGAVALVPRPGNVGTEAGGSLGATTSHARGTGLSFAPSADQRREFAASGSRASGTTLHEAPVSRLQGQKTLVSRLGQPLREQRLREEKPTSDDGATPPPEAGVEAGSGRIHRE